MSKQNHYKRKGELNSNFSCLTFLGINRMDGKKLGFGAKPAGSELKHPYTLACWGLPHLHLLAGEIPKSPPFHSQKCLGLTDKLHGHLILNSALPFPTRGNLGRWPKLMEPRFYGLYHRGHSTCVQRCKESRGSRYQGPQRVGAYFTEAVHTVFFAL